MPTLPDRAARQENLLSSLKSNDYWMRSVSFAGLHRILGAVAAAPEGLTASEINESVLKKGLRLTQTNSRPAPSTLYHYRNTLLRLHVLKRVGRRLQANLENSRVREILRLPLPSNRARSLDPVARERFAGLVLENNECRLLFFDLFISPGFKSISAADFRKVGVSVEWWNESCEGSTTEAVLCNKTTRRVVRCASPASKNAVLYGLRYWARDELQMIDEYTTPSGRHVTMFPLSELLDARASTDSAVIDMVQAVLSLCTASDWTELSVYELILQCCETRRKPKTLLFSAIDWLLQTWPYHVALVPTSPALATLNTTSHYRESLQLQRFYRGARGPHISHIRIHKAVNLSHHGGNCDADNT